MFFILWIVWIPYTIIDIVYYNFSFPPSEFYIFYIVFAILTYIIGLLGFKINNDTIVQIAVDDTKKITIEMIEVANTIRSEMIKNKLFLHPELDLKSFSEKLDLHPNKISAIVNAVMNQSFRDFVNTCRVEEFKQKAQSYNFIDKTILGLAYESGFNSKASFYRAFQKHENTSPIEFVKNL